MKTFSWAKLACSAALVVTALCSVFAQPEPGTNAPTGLTLVSPESIQFPATYWFMSSFDATRSRFGPPLPWNPFGSNTNVPIYYWAGHGNSSYVVDDTVLPEEEQEQWFREHSGDTELTTSSQSFSMEGPDSENPGSGDSFYANYGTNLWLEIPSASNGIANVILHNVTQGRVYELMSSRALPVARWYAEQALFTVSNRDWIATTVLILDRTNALFFWARDWTGIDENTNSVPDWQEWTNYGPPVAFSQSLHTMTNTALNLFLQTSDPENLPLTYVFLGGPTNGALSGTPPNLVYTPATNYDGLDGFAYQVTDGAFWSQPATVSISVDTALD